MNKDPQRLAKLLGAMGATEQAPAPVGAGPGVPSSLIEVEECRRLLRAQSAALNALRVQSAKLVQAISGCAACKAGTSTV